MQLAKAPFRGCCYLEANMEPVDWGQAWGIVGGGVLVVFLIMSLLASITSLLGRIVQGYEAKKKAQAAAAGEAKK